MSAWGTSGQEFTNIRIDEPETCTQVFLYHQGQLITSVKLAQKHFMFKEKIKTSPTYVNA